jgi:hypothetical protein
MDDPKVAQPPARSVVTSTALLALAGSVVAWALVFGAALLWATLTNRPVGEILPRICIAAGGAALACLALAVPRGPAPRRRRGRAEDEGSGREVRIPVAGTAASLAVELLLVGFFVA